MWVKRGWVGVKRFSRRLVPDRLYNHGRTVYGGSPVIQQTLPGWFAYISPFYMIPIFFLLMIPFLVVGAVMIVESRKVYVLKEDYSQIHQYQYTPKDASININQGIRDFVVDGVSYPQGTLTWQYIYVKQRLEAPVYFYYTLDNYYQNYRDFHDGRNLGQLKGDKEELGSPTLCKPFIYPGYRRATPQGQDGTVVESVVVTGATGTKTTYSLQNMKYNPCGLAAWATFNDTFVLYQVVDASNAASAANANAVINSGANGSVPMRLVCDGTAFDAVGTPTPAAGSTDTNYCAKKGISFTSDVTIRYRPLVLRENQWSRDYPYVTNNSYLNAGYYYKEAGHAMPDPTDYDFQVWMRSAVLSSFKKLYRIINVDLEPGWYAVQINEFYDVVSFKGRKGVAFRTRHWVGENNTVLGIL
ncbi:hypothetical protein STCU_01240 [Strigomonas culicis]|nr:hypothetical protein STCU_01240 [Strigomonas culicis]|eukprot:EPY35120.1 hypothetical protein STCU_01240 [Strigomonas culicis]